MKWYNDFADLTISFYG